MILELVHFLDGFNGGALVMRRLFPAVKLQVVVCGDLHIWDLMAEHSLKHLVENLLPLRCTLGHYDALEVYSCPSQVQR
jgi:hypothetical protein